MVKININVYTQNSLKGKLYTILLQQFNKTITKAILNVITKRQLPGLLRKLEGLWKTSLELQLQTIQRIAIYIYSNCITANSISPTST